MGEKLLGYGPQGFALEVNPWQTKSSIEATLLYRGAIVAAWANVETSLIEVAIRASKHGAYSDHRGAYPSKLKTRIRYLREILVLPGPLQPFRTLGEAILNRYAAGAELRNMMAHARMTVLPTWGATFYGFQAASEREIIYQTRRMTEPQLEALAKRTTRFSRAVRMLIAQLDTKELLPALGESPAAAG